MRQDVNPTVVILHHLYSGPELESDFVFRCSTAWACSVPPAPVGFDHDWKPLVVTTPNMA